MAGLNTRRKIHAAKQKALKDAAADRKVEDTSFRYKHDEQMRKMLKGVDLDRYERLADGG